MKGLFLLLFLSHCALLWVYWVYWVNFPIAISYFAS